MKRIEERLWLYMLELAAFCAILLFGIFYGPQYPNLFFWGFMCFFAIFIVTTMAPTKKDIIILIVGMAALAIWGTVVDKLVNYLLGEDSLLGFIVSLILLAPVYFPLANHFFKMCQKMVIRLKQKQFEGKNN